MQHELLKEKIVLNRRIGQEFTQAMMEGDVIVPDVLPDMAFILKTDASFIVDKTEVSNDRVNYSGRLCLNVLYLAKGSDKPVHNISVVNGVDDFINMEGVTKDTWVEIGSKITNMDYKMLNDRKLGYRALIDISAVAEAPAECDVITSISGLTDNQQKKSLIEINKTVDNKTEKFIVKGSLAIPSGKPNIREILQSTVTITNKDVKVSSGRVSVSGELLIATLYKGDDDGSIVDFCEHELPFNGSIEVAGAKDDMFSEIVLSVNDQYIQARQDEDGENRAIDAEVSIFAAIKLNHQTEVEILEDAYCVNSDVKFKKEVMMYPKIVCRNKNQYPVKEVCSLDAECPDILQIFRVTGDVCVDDYSIIEDKVVVEGVVSADILYVAKNDNAPLYNQKALMPYRQVIETKGARDSMKADISAQIEHVSFNMLSDREVELRFLVGFNAKISDEVESCFITDIDFMPLDQEFIDNIASLTIYVVQKGDTLWSIAKRYNTTIEDLVAINEIEDPNKIYPGQKILIIKKC